MLNEYQAWKFLEKQFKNARFEFGFYRIEFRIEFGYWGYGICGSVGSLYACRTKINYNIYDKMVQKLKKERKRRKLGAGTFWWSTKIESGRKCREQFCAKMAQECRSKK